MLNDPLEVP